MSVFLVLFVRGFFYFNFSFFYFYFYWKNKWVCKICCINCSKFTCTNWFLIKKKSSQSLRFLRVWLSLHIYQTNNSFLKGFITSDSFGTQEAFIFGKYFLLRNLFRQSPGKLPPRRKTVFFRDSYALASRIEFVVESQPYFQFVIQRQQHLLNVGSM